MHPLVLCPNTVVNFANVSNFVDVWASIGACIIIDVIVNELEDGNLDEIISKGLITEFLVDGISITNLERGS